MRCDGLNGYLGWSVIDVGTGAPIPYVMWVDPDAKQYCTHDMPLRVVGNEVAVTVHEAEEIRVEVLAASFFVKRGPITSTVAPLSPGRQQEREPTGRPCPECCQEAACRRTAYCAAHRCGFGERAP